MSRSMPAIPDKRFAAPCRDVPSIVLIGPCGHGKSSVAEMLTDLKGLSSAASSSFTTFTSTYRSTCGRLEVTDTPGTDALATDVDGRMQNCLHIASALSSCPVTLLMIVVRAETRLERVVSIVRGFSDNFLEFERNLAVCVTHMDLDQVTWSETECSDYLNSQLDLKLTVFSRLDTPGPVLFDKVLSLCMSVGTPLDFTIDSSNFLKYFTVQDSHRGILKSVKDEVGFFRKLMQDFHTELGKLPQGDQPDAVFEFQAFMKDEVDKICERVSEKYNLGEALMSDGTKAQINAIGHISSLKLQLRSVLASVRRFAMLYQIEVDTSDLRKCPHCGLIWTKVAGCPDTTCGNLMKTPDARRESMATFLFEIDNRTIAIKRIGEKPLAKSRASGKGVGCGKSIKWDEMRPVQAPAEISLAVTPTADDVMLVEEAQRQSWHDYYALQSAKVQSQQKGTRTSFQRPSISVRSSGA